MRNNATLKFPLSGPVLNGRLSNSWNLLPIFTVRGYSDDTRMTFLLEWVHSISIYIFFYFVSVQDIPRWVCSTVQSEGNSCSGTEFRSGIMWTENELWSGLEKLQSLCFGVSGACYLIWCENHASENALGLGSISAFSQVQPLILHEDRLFWGGWVQAHFLKHWLVMEVILGEPVYFIMWMQHELYSGMKLIQEWKSLRYNIISPLIWPLLCGHLFKEDIVTL